MNHLYEAKRLVEQSGAKQGVEWAQFTTQQAIAHALIALAERVDMLIELNASEVQAITAKGLAAVAEMPAPAPARALAGGCADREGDDA